MCNLDANSCEMLSDAAPADDGGPLVARTVQQVRDPQTPVSTPVELTNVIVTAVDLYGGRIGELWVQQPGGGMGSGIKVYGAERSEVALLGIGDVIDVTGGQKSHFTNANDLTGRFEIQVSPLQELHIARTGATATPVITPLNWVGISNQTGSQLDEERAKWAGTLVRATMIPALEPPMTLAADPTLQQFAVPGFHVQSLLAPFPSGIDTGTCFQWIVGVIEYNYNYYIQPPTTADVMMGCP